LEISKKEWEILGDAAPARIFRKGETVYLQGSHAGEFYYLKKGRVKIFLSSEDGGEKTLTIIRDGSIFGEAAFFDGQPRVSSARTLEDSEIAAVDGPGLMECFRREPRLAMSLLSYLSQTIRMLSAQVDTLSFREADERLASLLLKLSEGGTVRATHEDLAGLAGVSRVTASRILSDFARKGWIDTRYREIAVLDPDALGGVPKGDHLP
jgi:CRP-like cAMP-binding protein